MIFCALKVWQHYCGQRDSARRGTGRERIGLSLLVLVASGCSGVTESMLFEGDGSNSGKDAGRDVSSHDARRDVSSHDAKRDVSFDAKPDVSSSEAKPDVSSRDAKLDVSSHDANADVSFHDAKRDVSFRDARRDVSPRDAGPDVGPPVITFACPGSPAPIVDCSGCSGYPLGCVYCQGPQFIGVCLQGGLHCQYHIPAYDTMCPCDAAAPCQLSDQVCIDGVGCGTCGQAESDGLECQNGGTCDEGSGDCE